MTGMVAAVAFCLTTIQSAWAIGWSRQTAGSFRDARNEVRHAQGNEARQWITRDCGGTPDLPLLAAQVVVRNGAEVDPDNLAGTASMTGSLLTKGTETMSAPEIASAIESLGGSIDSGAGWDASVASVVVMSDKADAALKILADVVLHPAFKQEEIDRLKSQRLDGLRVALQQPGSLARFVTDAGRFRAGAYGHAASGTLGNVAGDRARPHRQALPKILLAAKCRLHPRGKRDARAREGFRREILWRLENDETTPNEQPPSGAADWKPKNIVIDMPEAGQAAVTVARPAIERTAPDYYSALVANAALGNGFVSRLNREIRIKRGLSYGAGSSIDPRREVGPFSASAQTKNESAAEVAGLMQIGVETPGERAGKRRRTEIASGGFDRSLCATSKRTKVSFPRFPISQPTICRSIRWISTSLRSMP